MHRIMMLSAKRNIWPRMKRMKSGKMTLGLGWENCAWRPLRRIMPHARNNWASMERMRTLVMNCMLGLR